VFEYAAAGLAVIAAHSNLPIHALLAQERCGVTVSEEDPASIAEAIRSLLRDRAGTLEMGERGRQAVVEKYTWAREAEHLVRLYASLESKATN
jgi:glycosyltransferase involved in cell wall biosynthesis